MKSSHKIGALLLLVVLVIVTVFFLSPKSSGQTFTITLKDTGFEPQSLNIRQGDSIVFKTDQKQEFWPASDLHPTHGIYPEFDPQQPIGTSSAWTFTFNKKGVWKFHDHLNPEFNGKISVRNSNSINFLFQDFFFIPYITS